VTERIPVLLVLGVSAGGVGRHVAEIVRALDGKDGLAIDVAAPARLRVAMPKPVVPVEIPAGPVRGHAGAVRRLRDLLRRGGYSLVHGHGLRASLDAAIAARFAGVPAVSTLHNVVMPEVSGALRARLYRQAEPLVVRLSARTFVPSQDIADRLSAAARRSAHKIEVLYAGTAEQPVARRSRDEVRRELGLESADRLVVTVARLHPQKALPVMLEAIARLDDSVVLAVIGEGPLERELKEEARVRGLDKRVRWLGFRAEVADFVAAAEVFCLSSLWEAVPLAAQEAVQLGTPVVATDVGGVAELITEGESGRLVPKNDATALAAALEATLASEDLRARYAANARAGFERRFARDAIIARLREVYTASV
jgi:glycosyltransferase involved in cell wall biosynthesis